jgi:lysyl-tRNA synthetase class II
MSTGDESDQVIQRRANLDELQQLGVDPYPRRFDSEATIEAIVAAHGNKSGEELESAGITVRTA